MFAMYILIQHEINLFNLKAQEVPVGNEAPKANIEAYNAIY